MAEIGGSLMDFLVQPAFCHIPLGEICHEFKIAFYPNALSPGLIIGVLCGLGAFA